MDIVNLDDPNYPKNLFTQGDVGTLGVLATQITFDDTLHIGQATEINVRLFTETLLQYGDVSTENLSLYFVNGVWSNHCSFEFYNGLYPGEYIGQLLCKSQPSTVSNRLEFRVAYKYLIFLCEETLEIDVLAKLPYNATTQFFDYNGTLVQLNDSVQSIGFEFGLVDEFGNDLDSS